MVLKAIAEVVGLVNFEEHSSRQVVASRHLVNWHHGRVLLFPMVVVRLDRLLPVLLDWPIHLAAVAQDFVPATPTRLVAANFVLPSLIVEQG